jgi:hypothetical protein
MVMVPVLVVISGALAFSAFSGTATTNVSATAGYLSWDQSITSTYTFEHNTAVSNNSSNVGTVHTPTSGKNATNMILSVSNLAPGNWVVFNITIKNTGSVGFILTQYSPSVIFPSSPAIGLAVNGEFANFSYGHPISGHYLKINVTEVQSGSIDPGQSASYQVFIGLGQSTGNAYQGSSVTLRIPIIVTSDP